MKYADDGSDSDEWLLSPPIDLSGATGAQLSYDYNWESDWGPSWSEGYVLGSTDGGATWTQLIYTFQNNSAWVYHISFQKTELVASNYLAYVLSEVYSVNQVDYEISEGLAQLTGLTPLSEFHSYITTSMGATAVIVDIHGIEKNTGDLNDGDRLKVTSADGKIVVMYDLNLDLTSAGTVDLQQIEIYPNPATGKLNIRGIEPGNRIQLYSVTGALIRDMKAKSNLEILSLEDVPSGMFLIVISNENQMLGRYKLSRIHSK